MLEILKIKKKFVNSPIPALDGVSLHIQEGECLSLLGPSGCGKTTLLRILAGFDVPEEGQILLNGQDLVKVSVAERPFHMVFQRHALFPHLTVFENIAFGLRIRKTPASEIQTRVQELLSLVRLEGFEKRLPATLSGGQSQRVALARALANRPRVLLLDEPFSALDLKLREGMATELRDLQKRLKLTFVFVTHDQQEAFALSDRVAMMSHGRIEQVSTPQDLYHNPQSLSVARFVGTVSQLPIEKVRSCEEGRVEFEFHGALLRGRTLRDITSSADSLVALIRPEDLCLDENKSTGENKITVRLKDWVFRGSHLIVRTEPQANSDHEILFSMPAWDPRVAGFIQGQNLTLWFDPEDALVCSRTEVNS